MPSFEQRIRSNEREEHIKMIGIFTGKNTPWLIICFK